MVRGKRLESALFVSGSPYERLDYLGPFRDESGDLLIEAREFSALLRIIGQ